MINVYDFFSLKSVSRSKDSDTKVYISTNTFPSV